MSEPTDQEMYKTIMEEFKKKDKKILEQEERIKKLEEKQNEKTEKGKSIRGYCSDCRKTLTEEEIKGESCPDCGSTKFNTYPR